MKIFENVKLHSVLDEQVVEGYLVELSKVDDKHRAIYRLKHKTFFVAVFYNDEGEQIIDAYTSYFLDVDMYKKYRTRIILDIGNLSYKEYVNKVIYKALISIKLAVEPTEVMAVEKVISNFLSELEKLT